jgi:hypothetical protein
VRIAPNLIAFNTVTALYAIYGYGKNVVKADSYEHLRVNKRVVSICNATDVKEHAFRKRIMAQGFSYASLRSMEERILGHVRVFCEELGRTCGSSEQLEDVDDTGYHGVGNDPGRHDRSSGWSKPYDVAQWANYMAFDILGSLSFSKGFGMLEKEEKLHTKADHSSAAAERCSKLPPLITIFMLFFQGLVLSMSLILSRALTS